MMKRFSMKCKPMMSTVLVVVMLLSASVVHAGEMFRNDEKNIVIDLRTGLMWENTERTAEPLADDRWASAIDYCESLTLAGYSDWRLPNVKELYSIMTINDYYSTPDDEDLWVDVGVFRAGINLYGHPGVVYWTSTTSGYIDPYGGTYAYILGLSGSIGEASKVPSECCKYARCVRNDQ